MMDASNVTIPSLSGFAPSPTQQLSSFSVTMTPCSTASKALPPLFNTSQAATFALNPASQVDATIGWILLDGFVDWIKLGIEKLVIPNPLKLINYLLSMLILLLIISA